MTDVKNEKNEIDEIELITLATRIAKYCHVVYNDTYRQEEYKLIEKFVTKNAGDTLHCPKEKIPKPKYFYLLCKYIAQIPIHQLRKLVAVLPNNIEADYNTLTQKIKTELV